MIPLPPTNCVHRWLLDKPAGGQTRGQCRLCDTVRFFDEEAARVAEPWRESRLLSRRQEMGGLQHEKT